MELVEKVRNLLTAEFPPPSVVDLNDDDGIIGTVVSPSFWGVETIDRINRIWDLLDRALTPEERRRVVTIVAATPEEEKAYTA